MEFESTEKLQMVYETLKNIETAITRLTPGACPIYDCPGVPMTAFSRLPEAVLPQIVSRGH
jgi:hypothetical protein